MPRIARAALALSLVVGVIAAPSCGAEYPEKPIRLIVNFPPGGTADILARLIGPRLAESLKQQVVIENRVGASGMIGASAIARAAPDGYTFGTFTSTHAMSPALLAKPVFDPVRDFAPITRLVSVPNLISVHPSVNATTIEELVALAKAQPGKLAFGSAGTGTAVHLTGELFKLVAGVDITHVPYKGGGPAITDLLAGQIPMGVQNISTIVQHVRAGKVRALGISKLERSSALPNVPTIASAGYAGFEANEWYGLVAPANTPKPIVSTLNNAIVRIMRSPEMTERMADQGADIVADTPESFGAFIQAELDKWTPIIRQTGARME